MEIEKCFKRLLIKNPFYGLFCLSLPKEVTRNYPKTYDKCGWNIPDVKWWLDCLIPKEIEL